jgi:hypothetical protein
VQRRSLRAWSTSPPASTARRFEVWLPHRGQVRLGPLHLPDGAYVTPPPTRPQWTTYGSSITQYTGADGPSETWPALVASANDWTLRCLGFARQCHLDPVVARLIRDTPADLISLCVGTNIHGASSFGARTLAPALAGPPPANTRRTTSAS